MSCVMNGFLNLLYPQLQKTWCMSHQFLKGVCVVVEYYFSSSFLDVLLKYLFFFSFFNTVLLDRIQRLMEKTWWILRQLIILDSLDTRSYWYTSRQAITLYSICVNSYTYDSLCFRNHALLRWWNMASVLVALVDSMVLLVRTRTRIFFFPLFFEWNLLLFLLQ